MNITAKDFLQMLYGKCTEGRITITTLPDSRNEHIPVTELDEAAEHIKVLGTRANTYYCVALRQERLPSSIRGGIEQIHTVVCMVADVDVLGPAHKETALPKTEREAIAFCERSEAEAVHHRAVGQRRACHLASERAVYYP